MAFSGVLTATVVLAFAMTLMMGLRAAAIRRRSWHGSPTRSLPSIVLQQQVPWPVALGIVFWAWSAVPIACATPCANRSHWRFRPACGWRLQEVSVSCSP